jgi:hypothetical protein
VTPLSDTVTVVVPQIEEVEIDPYRLFAESLKNGYVTVYVELNKNEAEVVAVPSLMYAVETHGSVRVIEKVVESVPV